MHCECAYMHGRLVDRIVQHQRCEHGASCKKSTILQPSCYHSWPDTCLGRMMTNEMSIGMLTTKIVEVFCGLDETMQSLYDDMKTKLAGPHSVKVCASPLPVCASPFSVRLVCIAPCSAIS